METTTENIPQCWQDFNDVIAAGVDRVILYGPPGTGKTFAGLNAGNVQGGAYRLICTEDMTAADVTGCWMPAADNRWEWSEGQMVKAWNGDGLNGGRAVIDEIDKASGDVLSLLLAMTDSEASARWEHPANGKVMRPREGFSVIMTTNMERMQDLPEALKDRFPVSIRINTPHPGALEALAPDLRAAAASLADADKDRRFSIRTFAQFDSLRQKMDTERAARLLFGKRANDILDAIKVDSIASF
jgi:MoxR-like ATPase